MPAVNFLDPYFFVRIGDAQASETRIFASHGGPEAEKPDLGRFVASIEIEEAVEFVGKITVELTPPRDLGLELLDGTIFALGNLIEVSWGYPSYGAPRKSIGMLTIPTVTLGKDVNITLNAEGLGSSLMRTEGHTVWRKAKDDTTADSYSAREIIEKLAMSLNMPVEFKLGPRSLGMETAPTSPFTQTMSKWLFMRYLAKRHGASIFMQGGTKLMVVGNDLPDRRGAATFRMYGQLDSQKNVYPLLEFSTEQAGHVIGLASRGVSVHDVHPDLGVGQNLTEEATAEGTEATPNKVSTVGQQSKFQAVGGGDAAVQGKTLGGPPTQVPAPPGINIANLLDAPFDDSLNEIGKRLHISSRDPQLPKRAAAENAISRITAIEATAEVIGVPNLFTDDVVKIEGVGKLFEKNYWITKIVHHLGSGYDMTLSLAADALGVENALSSESTTDLALNMSTESADTMESTA